jgi:hypothetical protein
MDRRTFVFQALGILAASAVNADAAVRDVASPNHPEPRPGITAANVLKAEQVASGKEEFDMVREIPHIVDGIRCPCGCSDREGYYSLLSCFEGEGMAQNCRMCRNCARTAHRLHGEGKDLNAIRAAIDERFD